MVLNPDHGHRPNDFEDVIVPIVIFMINIDVHYEGLKVCDKDDEDTVSS